MPKPLSHPLSANAPKAPPTRRYKVAGMLADGVAVLAPKIKPTNFTARQIRSTIEKLRRNSEIDGEAKAGAGRG